MVVIQCKDGEIRGGYYDPPLYVHCSLFKEV